MNKAVLGIDPAPAKKSTIYDGKKFMHFSPEELRRYLSGFKEKDVLICWDAPLTGPGIIEEGKFSMRQIERVLGAQMRKAKVAGVSVLPYSGCSHWAISRSMLGLPRVGEYDSENIPFPLTFSRSFQRAASAEVHPAVAMYYWLGDMFTKYKGSGLKSAQQRAAVQHNFRALRACPVLADLHSGNGFDANKELSDDELDAWVSWALGVLWLQGTEVVQLGDAHSGAMLLPNHQEKLAELALPNDGGTKS